MMMNRVKEVSYYKGGKLEKTKDAECNPLTLAPASETIQREWYDVIQEVFHYDKKRGADLQEIHKLFLDDRIEKGYEIYKQGHVTQLVKTDVDIRASVKSSDGSKHYTVIIKNWLPEVQPRRRYEMVHYMEKLFIDCSCEDHTTNGHYRSNSSLCCKHIAAVLWFLQNEDAMPKIFELWNERTLKYKKSRPNEILSKLYGLPMKKFTPYLNVLNLKKFKEIPDSLSLSIHRELNEPDRYGKEPYKPTWITFTQPDDVLKIIEALQVGHAKMLECRQLTDFETKTPQKEKESTPRPWERGLPEYED